MEVAVLALAGSATALAAGLGAVPVFLLGPRAERLRPFLWGMAVGLMGVAPIAGMLLRALNEGNDPAVGAGLATGVPLLLATRSRVLLRHARARGVRRARDRAPEHPRGNSIAIPMESAGFGRAQQFWAAVLTSAPQPVGAVAAYLAVQQIDGLLPFAFAAGAMLSLVLVDLVPAAFARGGRAAAAAGRWSVPR
jgi:zinc transporter, ZIP family